MRARTERFAIADAEWVFLRDTDDMVAGIERLAEALDADLQWRDQHTRLAGRVLASAIPDDRCMRGPIYDAWRLAR